MTFNERSAGPQMGAFVPQKQYSTVAARRKGLFRTKRRTIARGRLSEYSLEQLPRRDLPLNAIYRSTFQLASSVACRQLNSIQSSRRCEVLFSSLPFLLFVVV